MDLSRKLAGYTLILASLGLAGISGFVSNSGLSAMLPGIPGIGYLGFVIAVALVGLGVAVSSEVASQRFAGAAIFAAFLAGTAFTDRQTNFISFQSQVQAADQVAEDRNAAYRESAQALKLTRAEISKLEAELVLMQSQDAEGIKKAQLLLSGLGLYEGKIDGQRGPRTLNAMRAYGKALRERLGTLRTDETKHSSIVSQGEVKSAAPFDMDQASLYATLITVFSVLLSFAGGYLTSSGKEDEIEQLEEIADTIEADVLDLHEWLNKRAA